MWVAQGASFEVPLLSEEARQSFGELLAAEADTASGLGPVHAVFRAAEAELLGLLTKTERVKKGGLYDRLLSEKAEVAAALEGARKKADEAAQRLARLAELQELERVLADAEAARALQAAIEKGEARLSAVTEARTRLQQLNERIAFLESQKLQRAQTLAQHDEDVAEMEGISQKQVAADRDLAEIATRFGMLDDVLGETGRQLADLERREADLRLALERARAQTHSDGQRRRLQELTQRSERLAQMAAVAEEIDTQLAGQDWPGELLDELRDISARRADVQARLTAQAPRLKIRYVPGRTIGFSIDGEALSDGDERVAQGATRIMIEGVGEIEVVPAGAAGLQALEAELSRLDQSLRVGLGRMGAQDLREAVRCEALRGELRQRQAVLMAERLALAPEGGQRVEQEAAALKAAIDALSVDGDAAPDAPQSGMQLMTEIEELLARKGQLMEDLDKARTEKSALDVRRTGIAVELRISRLRREELQAKMEQAGGREALRGTLEQHARAAEEALNEAVRDRIALRELALPDAALSELRQAVDVQRADLAGRGERLGVLRQDMRLIEGQLARDFEDGPGEQLAGLQERLQEVQLRISKVELRIAALQLLLRELNLQMTRLRDQITLPLARRLEHLARGVWPTAEMALGADLRVDGLMRDGVRETVGAVSAGTREQVAVLARLAFAGMIAEGAEAAPLILDDPLAFSDDNRLEALFAVLAEAGQQHQILVLTCHERAFEPLITRYDARRLTVEPAT